MTEKRLYESLPGMRICYPEFQEDETGTPAKRSRRRQQSPVSTMNAFYRALRDAAAAYANELCTHAGGSRCFTADYTSRIEGSGILIAYTFRLRYRGHTEAQKTVRHLWQDGVLIPPAGSQRHPQKKSRSKTKKSKEQPQKQATLL